MKIRYLWLLVLLTLWFPAGASADSWDAFLTPQEEESLFKGTLQSIDRMARVLSVNEHSFQFTPSTRFFMRNGEPTSAWNLRPGMQVGLVVERGVQGAREEVGGQDLFALSKVVILKP
jgi:hypothetical protein